MVKIAISGVCGHMGRMLVSCIADRADCEICCGIDLITETDYPFPVYSSVSEMQEKPDVIIDYSHPSTLSSLLSYAAASGVPIVLSTTGYSEEQLQEIQEASQKTALFSSFNMSIGIQLLLALSRKAAAVLGNQFDIEIIEKHHNQKLDAPSGTAIMIANAIIDETDPKKHLVYDRHSVRQKRDMTEIGMHSIRGGTIVGEHEVLFAGPDECISIKHTASSKRVFAEGSINAAMFLIDKAPKLYDMTHLLAEA